MLILGDSINAGIGAGHISEGCMALLGGRLQERYPRLRVLNIAVPSQTSNDMLAPGAQLERALEAIATLQAEGQRAGPIVLGIGANDALEAATVGEERARDRFAVNLEISLDRLAEAVHPQGDRLADLLIVETFYNVLRVLESQPGLPNPDHLAPRRARRLSFNAVTREAAARRGLRLADLAAAFAGRELELTWARSGDIHPNAAGQCLIRDTVMDAGGWGAAAVVDA